MRRPVDLGATNAGLKRACDSGRDSILQLEHVGHDSVEPVGPDMAAGLGFDELAGDPPLLPGAAHAALKNIADAEPLADITHIRALALEAERGVARDHEQGAEARQGCRNLLHDPVGEPFRVRIVGDGLEWKDNERRPRRFGRRSSRALRRPGRSPGLNFDLQAVAALDDCAQDPPLAVADRAPNVAHALGDAVLGDRHVGPDGVEQLITRQDAPRMARQHEEEVEGLRPKRDLCSIAVAQHGAVDVQQYISEPEHLHGGPPSRAPGLFTIANRRAAARKSTELRPLKFVRKSHFSLAPAKARLSTNHEVLRHIRRIRSVEGPSCVERKRHALTLCSFRATSATLRQNINGLSGHESPGRLISRRSKRGVTFMSQIATTPPQRRSARSF